MPAKIAEIAKLPPGNYGLLKASVLQRKHCYSASGAKIDLPQEARLNTLIIGVKDPLGNVKKKEFYFNGNELLLSEWQKRQYTPELLAEVTRVGERVFHPDSSFKVVTYDEMAIQTRRDYITASDLFDLNYCPHLLWKNYNGNLDDRDPPNLFIKLLREKGIQHEKEVVAAIGECLDLSGGNEKERIEKTLEAMSKKVPLIYQGYLRVDELKGIPDLLMLRPNGKYIPIDIKAAMAYEGGDDGGFEEGKLNDNYAMQLALYVDALVRLGFADEHVGIILNIDREQIVYDLDTQRNKRDKRIWWEIYQEKKKEALALKQNRMQNGPALFSGCALCRWCTSCRAQCEEENHTSLLHQIGRSYSEILKEDANISTVYELARINPEQLLLEKRQKAGDFLKGIGDKVIRAVDRARYMLSGAKGVKILNPISFPKKPIELHFDIEADPTQNIVYLHGVVVREGDKRTYHSFVAEDITPEAEEKAFKEFWDFVRTFPEDTFAAYHYSHYEKTMYNKLREKYPDVISKEELDKFFLSENCVDLYRIVERDTDWPLKSYSLKAIAKLINFKWRDVNPSGTASIEWYNRWAKSGRDPILLKRILEYNEDDCLATIVVKDYLEKEMQEYLRRLENQFQKVEEKPTLS